MKFKQTFLLLGSLLAANASFSGSQHNQIKPDSHAPISVMGDHMHKKGEWMFSYRFMQMNMEGNLRGSEDVSSNEIVTQLENPNPGPPTVRVVPVDMTTDMHMFGMMYAPNDKVTLMVMLNYLDKSMDHLTYMGMMGTNQLGQFTTQTSGIGDTKIATLWKVHDSSKHKVHLNLGWSLPTGSIDEEGKVLTPMNTRPKIRLPYPMQLGSGTYDFEPGMTYSGSASKLGWGLQYKAAIRLDDNDESYVLGDKHKLTSWASYRIAEALSFSLGLDYQYEKQIDGRDTLIAAPVQTANPDNFGGKIANASFGLNYVGQENVLQGHRFALEYHSTIYQNANGVQMKIQDMLTLGYQFAF